MVEVADLTPERYEELTREPRQPPVSERSPLTEVGEIIEQYVRSSNTSRTFSAKSGGSVMDWSRVDDYKEQSNDNLTLEDVRMLTSDMPCVWEYYQRDDKYRHGYQSFVMETHCIGKLLRHNFPIDVIHEFLDSAPEYDEQYSQERIEKLIAQDFYHYRIENLLREAPTFCGYDWCQRCQNVIEDDEELQRIYNK